MDAALPAPAFASQVSGARRGEGALRRLPALLAPLRRPPRRAARGLRRRGHGRPGPPQEAPRGFLAAHLWGAPVWAGSPLCKGRG